MHFPQITLEQHSTLRFSGKDCSSEDLGERGACEGGGRVVVQVQQYSMILRYLGGSLVRRK